MDVIIPPDPTPPHPTHEYIAPAGSRSVACTHLQVPMNVNTCPTPPHTTPPHPTPPPQRQQNITAV